MLLCASCVLPAACQGEPSSPQIPEKSSSSSTAKRTESDSPEESLAESSSDSLLEESEEELSSELSYEPEIVSSGQYGDNVTYELNAEGLLTLSGEGSTQYCVQAPDSPFYHDGRIKTIRIEPSITEIGYCSFPSCSAATTISLADTVAKIGPFAFQYCSAVTSITIPNSVTEIGAFAFNGCTALTEIILPESVINVGEGAFSGWTSSQTIILRSNPKKWNKEWNMNCEAVIKADYPPPPAVIESGTCGENVTYELDEEGLLTISGDGEMSSYLSGKEMTLKKCTLIRE